MDLLLITNLYPPQELGGYGRCMADFCWGLQQRGHRVQVLCHDAPYLGPGGNGPSGEAVSRCLSLKGSFEKGMSFMTNPIARQAIDAANRHLLRHWLRVRQWDGILIGNIDLIGPELFTELETFKRQIIHHIGFMNGPYSPQQKLHNKNYSLAAASKAVRQVLSSEGFDGSGIEVIYPGARVELFGNSDRLFRQQPWQENHPSSPLKLCFAGLIMATKGVQTFVDALIQLHHQGISVQANLAGLAYQSGYKEKLEKQLSDAGLGDIVRFVGPLNRKQLARFFGLHHACVFPSIHPEAFGIVGAEAMASGLALISSGVGGARELIEDGESGLLFQPGDASDLARQLLRLLHEPGLLQRLSRQGEARARSQFAVEVSVRQLEALFQR
jgi:glycosyltransferase involved in cell wall biosynthesis